MGPTEGEWQWENDGTSDPQLVETEEGPNKGKLKEATCNAEPLAVSNYVDQVTRGMEILCVGDPIDTESKIPAQNSCILICDGYPILNFYTKTLAQTYIDYNLRYNGNYHFVDCLQYCELLGE